MILQEDIFQLTHSNAPGLMKITLIQQANKKDNPENFSS